MEYISTEIPNTVTVGGIVTVLRHVYDEEDRKYGESHDFPEILFINRGKHIAIVGEREFSLSAGQMLIYPPNVYHTVGALTGAEAFIISFKTENETILPIYDRVITLSTEQKQTLKQVMETGFGCFVPCGEAFRANGKQGMVLSENADEITLQRLKKQLEFFLADVLRDAVLPAKSGKPPRKARDFDAVCEFLEKNITQTLSVSDIARGSGMSVSKLKLVVRERSGGGVTELFNGMKIEKAKKLIAEGRLSYTDIAAILGFGSLHYFSRTFKKYSGFSPSEWEKRI